MPRTSSRKKKPKQQTLRPNHKLPPELITEIFEYLWGGIIDEQVYESEIPNAIDNHFSQEQSDLFRVSRVCSVWRQIAVPRIWQKVLFQLDAERDWEKLFQWIIQEGYVRFNSVTTDHISEDLPPVMNTFFSDISESCRSVRRVKIHTSALRGPNKDDTLNLPSVSNIISMVTGTVREVDLMMHVANQETIGALRDCKKIDRALVHCCDWKETPEDFYTLLTSWKNIKNLQIEPPHITDYNWEEIYTKSLQYLADNCGEQLEELWMPLREEDQKLFCNLVENTPNLKVLALEGRDFENDGHFLDVVARTTPHLNYIHLSYFPSVTGDNIQDIKWHQLMDVNIMGCEKLVKKRFFDSVKKDHCSKLNIHIYDLEGNITEER
ncbi:hypothetical protein GLOIN_2v1588273 [Rhizophagus irregularis DAOM 181602=DAOM 197198]|uniref:Uncharacterized protein n=1 Tax=Rhizophagus irregularis (strain DAOM 197198w) TaxID=1432141 RepID=A0A015LX43_RHIIW|nr:hypothetical protein RirG_025570 [Rhizophagus irregularis DAOM 197198w]GET60233.1 hypothetical protein GLOIN_2v1588273 [Rhizophagus irregularis DAOM 181602=DAOM 197198]